MHKKYLHNLSKYSHQGICNEIFISQEDNHQYVVKKLLNTKTDHKYSASIQQKASLFKIAPKILAKDKEFLIMQFIEGSHKQKLRREDIRQIIILLKKFHKITSKAKRVNLKKLLKQKDYHLLKYLNKFPKNMAVVHSDLNYKNIIFAKNRVYLIDFEYSSINDIYFDLASICVEFRLNNLEQRYLLGQYFKQKRANYKKLELYKDIYKRVVDVWFAKNMIK
ncbi:MAG: hypothetical protein DSZ06_01420 [Sulfurospirillum sp.]|nr:MAG: hypothetical protein DSZ06_01420 [Sulfurospirillum sp.]